MEFKSNECAWEKYRQNNEIEVCSSPEVIQKMKEFLKATGEKIDAGQAGVNDRLIVEKAKKKTGCRRESCVIQSSEFKKVAGESLVNETLRQDFKMIGPGGNSTTWLSNFEIDGTLSDLKRAYADQKFWNIPFQMRDLKKPDSSESLQNFDFMEKYNEGYRCFGVIVNTDYSSGNGIHWFSIFVDMRDSKNTIEFFDSAGDPPLSEISAWMKITKLKFDKYYRENGIDRETYVIIVSQHEHQTDNHSCGVYSIYFIYSRVAGIPYEYFIERIIKTSDMHRFRDFLFVSKRT